MSTASRSALVAALLVAGCASHRPVAPAPFSVAAPSPSAPAPEEPACALDATDVTFAEPLALQHELPPVGAAVEYHFARVRHAARVRVEVPPGDAVAVALGVTVETSMLRLSGVAHADSVPLYPARASTFDGFVTPLARHRLRWIRSAPGALLLSLSLSRRTSLRAQPAWRECSYLRLRPPPPFAPVGLPPPSRRRPLRLAAGRRALFSAPDDRRSARTDIDLLEGDEVTLLEESGLRWARILWVDDDAAFVGWIDRRRTPYAHLGYGRVGGLPDRRPPRCPHPARSPRELPLLVEDRGVRRAVGQVREGATLSVGATEGSFTQVALCDPDVELEGAAWIPSAALDADADRDGASLY